MKTFNTPAMDVEKLNITDVITTSVGCDCDGFSCPNDTCDND